MDHGAYGRISSWQPIGGERCWQLAPKAGNTLVDVPPIGIHFPDLDFQALPGQGRPLWEPAGSVPLPRAPLRGGRAAALLPVRGPRGAAAWRARRSPGLWSRGGPGRGSRGGTGGVTRGLTRVVPGRRPGRGSPGLLAVCDHEARFPTIPADRRILTLRRYVASLVAIKALSKLSWSASFRVWALLPPMAKAAAVKALLFRSTRRTRGWRRRRRTQGTH